MSTRRILSPTALPDSSAAQLESRRRAKDVSYCPGLEPTSETPLRCHRLPIHWLYVICGRAFKDTRDVHDSGAWRRHVSGFRYKDHTSKSTQQTHIWMVHAPIAAVSWCRGVLRCSLSCGVSVCGVVCHGACGARVSDCVGTKIYICIYIYIYIYTYTYTHVHIYVG